MRRNGEFDKAAALYEAIVSEFRQEAEAYWGLVLCKYGIEYVDDPATGKKIPTCHRSSFDSILEDSDFEQAMENADEIALRVYREEAKQIEKIREGILAISSSEKPYDIFICYKETDSKGNRTVDSLLAQTIYDALLEKGYRVFFSRITLENKLGQAYEPYIFAALNSARIMLAVGTTYENYNAVWVKNEWSRYFKIIAKDKNKYLIPCYKNIDAYDIPREFAHLQRQDMGKVGAMVDLLRGVEKLLPMQKHTVQISEERLTVANAGHVAPLLTRAMLFLEDRDWESADRYCEKVLDMEPKNAEAYFCKLMAECRVSGEEELGKLGRDFLNSPNYQKAFRFGGEEIREMLEKARKDTVYYDAKRLTLQKDNKNISKTAYKNAISQLERISGWRDADLLIEMYREYIVQIEAQEEADRQERKRQIQLAGDRKSARRRQAQKNSKKVRRLAGNAAVCICGTAALLMLLKPMLHDSSTQQTIQTEKSTGTAEAEALLANGETAKAAIAFGKLAGYSDAQERRFGLWNSLIKRDSIFASTAASTV